MKETKEDLIAFDTDGSLMKDTFDKRNNLGTQKTHVNDNKNGQNIPWNILIVDDEVDVHRITKMLLENFVFQDRPLNIISAHNETEAMKALSEHDDIALVLLDVVMDTEDSGLRLVKYIREIILNTSVRIIIRTGQPGQAPDRQVIVEYDINDYKLKTELTVNNLYVTIVAALRSYKDIKELKKNKLTLEKVIESSQFLFRERKMNAFSNQFPSHMKDIIDVLSGFIATNDGEHENYMMKAGFGKYQKNEGRCLQDVTSIHIKELVHKAEATNRILHQLNECIYCFYGQNEVKHVIYFEFNQVFNSWEKNICNLYVSMVGIWINNRYLSREVESALEEILFTLGEVAEARSQELGNHVKRVSKYVKLLALKCGLHEEEAELISMASPVHDIGKLAIPDQILNKPGKLSKEEFEVIKGHSSAGFEMLKNSKRPILKTASMIAIQHHEKWNGTGYPLGLKGEEIHIYGRIVAIADVFDALSSERVYKDSWSFDRILDYIIDKRGEFFDPRITDIFITHYQEFIEIHDKYLDNMG